MTGHIKDPPPTHTHKYKCLVVIIISLYKRPGKSEWRHFDVDRRLYRLFKLVSAVSLSMGGILLLMDHYISDLLPSNTCVQKDAGPGKKLFCFGVFDIRFICGKIINLGTRSDFVCCCTA